VIKRKVQTLPFELRGLLRNQLDEHFYWDSMVIERYCLMDIVFRWIKYD
jgi:hypothetical protein